MLEDKIRPIFDASRPGAATSGSCNPPRCTAISVTTATGTTLIVYDPARWPKDAGAFRTVAEPLREIERFIPASGGQTPPVHLGLLPDCGERPRGRAGDCPRDDGSARPSEEAASVQGQQLHQPTCTCTGWGRDGRGNSPSSGTSMHARRWHRFRRSPRVKAFHAALPRLAVQLQVPRVPGHVRPGGWRLIDRRASGAMLTENWQIDPGIVDQRAVCTTPRPSNFNVSGRPRPGSPRPRRMSRGCVLNREQVLERLRAFGDVARALMEV